jgi:hypothetical protein
MPRYDASHHEPPAPVASVTLRNPNNALSVSPQLLLIDSGADLTLIPRQAVEAMGISLDPAALYQVASFDGTKSFMPFAELDLIFLKRVYRGKYLLIDAPIGVLGRDVLNHIRLLLNGPALEWSESVDKS